MDGWKKEVEQSANLGEGGNGNVRLPGRVAEPVKGATTQETEGRDPTRFLLQDVRLGSWSGGRKSYGERGKPRILGSFSFKLTKTQGNHQKRKGVEPFKGDSIPGDYFRAFAGTKGKRWLLSFSGRGRKLGVSEGD